MTLRTSRTAALLLLASVSLAGRAGAVAVPDSARVVALASRCDGALVGMATTAGPLRLRDTRVTAVGFTGDEATGRDGAVTAFAVRPRLVTWAEIDRAERLGSYAKLGAKCGFVAGICLGFAAAAAIDDADVFPIAATEWDPTYGFVRRPSSHLGVTMLSAVVIPLSTTLLGTLAGSLVTRWERVLP